MTTSVEQLSAFVETVEKGGFKAASRSLGKHAVTISGLVANLEADIGFELFIRKPRSLEVTVKGKELYDYAKSVLRELEHFEAKVNSLLDDEPSRLTLAIDTTLRGPELSQIYRQLFQQFPTLDIKILNGDPLLVRNWVLTGQADIGFSLGTFSNHHELAEARAFSFQIVEVASPELGIGDQQLSLQRVRGMRQISVNFLKELGLSEGHNFSNKLAYCNNMYEMLELVKTCPVWAIMPYFVCQSALERGEVERFRVDREADAHWYTELIWRTERPVNPAMELFINQILKLPDR